MDSGGRRCLVTGGTGFLGKHLLPALVARGWQVRTLSRKPAGSAARPELPGVEYVRGDLASPDALRDAVRGVQEVFHIAGEKRNPARFMAVNVEGTRALLEACASAGAPAVVHLSSVGVVGRPTTNAVDETSTCRPEPGYELSKHQAEQVALDYHAKTGAPTVILRPANVFGDGDPEHHLLTMMRAIATGRFRLVGRRDSWLNYVYAGDVADACAQVVDGAMPHHLVYQLADPCTVEAFANVIATELGARTPVGRLSVPVGYAAALLGSAISAVRGRAFPFNLSKIQALRARTVYTPARIQAEFPQWPAHGWQSGLQQTIAAYRAEGLV